MSDEGKGNIAYAYCSRGARLRIMRGGRYIGKGLLRLDTETVKIFGKGQGAGALHVVPPRQQGQGH